MSGDEAVGIGCIAVVLLSAILRFFWSNGLVFWAFLATVVGCALANALLVSRKARTAKTGFADRVVNTLRDASLAKLARSSDALVRARIATLRTARRPDVTPAEGAALFPYLPETALDTPGIRDKTHRAKEAAWLFKSDIPERYVVKASYRPTRRTGAFKKEVARLKVMEIVGSAVVHQPDPPLAHWIRRIRGR